MIKIAHRGASGYAPENTLLSFQKALEMGVEAIELDVHLSADEVLVVIHDPTLDRTTNGTGLVHDFLLSDLKKLQVEGHQSIPTLSQVLDLIDKKCLVHIELKAKQTPVAVVKLIINYIKNKNWTYDLFSVSSFDWKLLEEIKALDPAISCGVLTETSIEKALVFAQKIQAKSIHPDFKLLTSENVKQIKQAGFQILAWTVNDPEAISYMRFLGVEGVFCNYPDRL
jgi:glycerophosphoryl diester phosphodiesterase